MDAAVAEMGGLDVLANVAGVNVFSKLEHMTLDVWNRHLAVNLTGPMLVTQAALPHLRESKGNVVTVASISGIQGQPYNSSYCASKGGLRLFMKALAVELAADGIRVNCVDPGGVDTAMSTKALDNLQGEIDYGHFSQHDGRAPRRDDAGGEDRRGAGLPRLRRLEQHHRRGDRRRQRHALVADAPIGTQRKGEPWEHAEDIEAIHAAEGPLLPDDGHQGLGRHAPRSSPPTSPST